MKDTVNEYFFFGFIILLAVFLMLAKLNPGYLRPRAVN